MRSFFLCVLLLFASHGVSAAEESPLAFTKRAYTQLSRLDMRTVSGNERALSGIKGLFDFQAFSRRCLTDIAPKISAAEYEELVSVFDRAFFAQIEKRGTKFSQQERGRLSYGVDRQTRETATGIIRFERRNGKKMKLDLFLVRSGASFRIADIAANGALLSRNYRGQFNRIFREHGLADLETRLQKKAGAT